MKKSTLIVLVLAAALGGFVYYHDIRNGGPKPAATPEAKPAFTFNPQDVTAVTIVKPSQTLEFEKKSGDWMVTKPIDTKADAAAVDGISNQLSDLRPTSTLAAQNDLSAFGLANPAITVDLQLKNGSKKELELGSKDFSGESVYGIADGSKQISLFPEYILTSADKSLDDWRDRTILPFMTDQVASFELKNPSGEIEATKESSKESSMWKIEKPRPVAPDNSSLDSLMSTISDGRFVSVASETPKDLAKFGLTDPSITFMVKLKNGKSETLQVGKLGGDNYYARDSERPMIFTVSADIQKKLDSKLFDFRDKKFYSTNADKLSSIDLHNSESGETISVHRAANGDWIFDQPAALKGKKFDISKISSPLDNATATDILDSVPAAVSGKLAKPAIEITLTGKDGKKTTIRISGASEGSVYAQASGNSAVYKLDKNTLDDLNFKASSATT